MFILEERVLNCCLLSIKGCHVEERLDLSCMALEGRIRANGADFSSALAITFC